MARLVAEVVLLRRGSQRHVHGRRRGVVQRVQERGHAGKGLGGGEELALVHGLLGEELRVGDGELGPFEEDASGLRGVWSAG